MDTKGLLKAAGEEQILKHVSKPLLADWLFDICLAKSCIYYIYSVLALALRLLAFRELAQIYRVYISLEKKQLFPTNHSYISGFWFNHSYIGYLLQPERDLFDKSRNISPWKVVCIVHVALTPSLNHNSVIHRLLHPGVHKQDKMTSYHPNSLDQKAITLICAPLSYARVNLSRA